MIKELTIMMTESAYDDLFEYAHKALLANGKEADDETVEGLVRVAFTAGCVPNVKDAIDWITGTVGEREVDDDE